MLCFQALFLDALIMKEGETIEKNNKQKVNDAIFYVGECMEFPSLGRVYHGLTIEQAVKKYQEIPEYLHNMGPGIGCTVQEGDLAGFDIELLSGIIDLDTINRCIDYKADPVIKRGIEKIQELMPDIEVWGKQEIDKDPLKKEGYKR